jgi:glycosidase
MRVAEYWTDKGIDGWRLDAPDSIQAMGFWQEFRDRIKDINPDAYILGEVVANPGQHFEEGHFDGIMNYLFRRHTIIFAAGNYAASIPPEYLQPRDDIPIPEMSAVAYANKMKHLLESLPCDDRFIQLNLLGSHDKARPITTLGGDRASLELSTLLLLTSPGAPCIYYGDEVGLPGGTDPDCRRSFPEDEARWDHGILAFHRKLIALRHAYPALRTGEYQPLLAQGEAYVFARVLGNEELIVAVNAGTHPEEVNVNCALKTRPREVLYGWADIKWNVKPGSACLMLVLPPRSAIIAGPAVG